MLYTYFSENNSFEVNFKSKLSLIVDPAQLCILLNKNKNWNFDDSNDYPYYKKNKKKINLMQVLFKFKPIDIFYEFKNNNKLDIRSNNVEIKHKLDYLIRSKFNIVDFIHGHYESTGIDAYIMKNPIWVTENNKYLMYCEKNIICTLCEKSYNTIKKFEEKNKVKLTWFKHNNNYLTSNPLKLYIQNVIMDFCENNNNNLIVYHINKNPLDNSYDNLKIIQNDNKKDFIIDCNNIIENINDTNINLKLNLKKRNNNLNIDRIYNKLIKNNYNITKFIPGHSKNKGIDANIMKNPIWITDDNKYLMYCEKDTICTLCEKSYKILKDFEKNKNVKITWFAHQNKYICGNPLNLYIHQIITNFYGNGKGTKNLSVDHIDRNPLNNSFDNLRIANRKEQENNSKGIMKNTKRAKSKNAYPLPQGITQDMLPKYVNINVYRGAYHMIFDKRENDIRYGLKMKMKTNDIKKELPKFKKKIKDKYSLEI